MQIINLLHQVWDAKDEQIRDSEDYMDKLFNIVDNIRLRGKDFLNERIIEKIFVSLSEKYEIIIISTLEDAKHLSIITLTEILNAWQAFE